MIEGGAFPNVSCHEQVEAIRRGWKWIPIESPVNHLEFNDQPILAVQDRIIINYPRAMHLFDMGHPDRGIGLSVTSPIRDAEDFSAVMQVTVLPTGETFQSVQDRLGSGIEQKMNLPEKFVWRKTMGPIYGSMTQPVRCVTPDGPCWIAWALVGLDTEQFVMINFSLFSPNAADREKYNAAAQGIVESIRLNPNKQH
jgi:hypothetical protein